MSSDQPGLICALILARGGSKGIPRKNLAEIGGRPLVGWAIETALASKFINEVYVSTDDEEIRDSSIRFGAQVPFLRPSSLATDESTDYESFAHFVEFLDELNMVVPRTIVHLRPTVPFRNPVIVDDAIRTLLIDSDADSLRSVHVSPKTPYKMWKRIDGYGSPVLALPQVSEPYNSPRQSLPLVYEQNCYVDVVRTSTITEKKSISGDQILLFETEPTLDIDTEDDLRIARGYRP